MKTNARDIIVVGTSAGGVEPLCKLVSALPADFPAALFIVMHVPGWRNSFLPNILRRRTPLTTVHAAAHNSIERGHIYIAPPDQHPVFNSGDRIELWHGPKEDNSRPSINALFRSAAVTFGSRVTGVVLTGTLEDGATGLWWIKRMGGATIVQDPAEAEFADMPRTALFHVAADYVAPVSEISAILDRLAGTNSEAVDKRGRRTPRMTSHHLLEATCPECRGPLPEVREDDIVEYHCLVGHRYSPTALLHAHAETQERALWSAVVALEEARNLVDAVAPHLPQRVRSSLKSEAEEKDRQAGTVREILGHLTPFRTE